MHIIVRTLSTFVILYLISFAPAYAGDCNKIHIESVRIDRAISTYHQIVDCLADEADTIVYVSGTGGEISDSLVFFDLVRSHSAICEKVKFVAVGRIASASNITWLAGCKRVVHKHSSFLLHGATWNMHDEDKRAREISSQLIIDQTTEVVRMAVDDKAAELWHNILSGNTQGTVLSAEDALELGWATTIIQPAE